MGKVDFMDTIYFIYMPFGKSLLKGSIGALGHGGGEFCNRGRMWRTKLHMNARGGLNSPTGLACAELASTRKPTSGRNASLWHGGIERIWLERQFKTRRRSLST